MNAVITAECRMQLKGMSVKEFLKHTKNSASQTYLLWTPVIMKEKDTGDKLWKLTSNTKAKLLPSKSSISIVKKLVKMFRKSAQFSIRIVKAEATKKEGIVNVTIQVYGLLNA